MPLIPTTAFLVLLAFFLFIDLAVLNRKAHVISAPEALKQTSVWVAIAFAFAGVIYFLYENHHFGLGLADGLIPSTSSTPPSEGPILTDPANAKPPLDPLLPHNGKEAAAMFAMGYLLELMLSLDNMMVIAIIMTYFKVPHAYQHRVLFWGIIGAVVFRGVMIALGAALIKEYNWLLYVFGAFLVLTAVKLLFDKEDHAPDLNKNLAVRLAKALFKVSPTYVGSNFFTRIDGKLAITPLMLALCAIEFADVIFAVDSIPAIFSTTKDPFIVLTSNCFAILGLRTMFFAITAITRKFPYLKQSMILILAFIGVKMLMPLLQLIPQVKDAVPGWDFHVKPLVSLPVIAGLMAAGVAASLLFPKDEPATEPAGHQ
jgi:tellurite resistance protein TerC